MKATTNKKKGYIMIGNDWDIYLKDEYNKPYFKQLLGFVEKEYQEKVYIQKKMKFLMPFVIQHLKT